MKKYELNNGLKIIELNRDSDIVTIQISVGVGSNNESKKISGISHFVEHLVFEGTKTRTSEEIANTIESLGGDISAFTSNEITGFYIKIVKKHFDIALEILSDVLLNPTFNEQSLEKERKIILSEIKMVTDQPRQYQWVLFCKTLFQNFPAKNPIYGTVAAVKSMTKQDLLNYHKKYYTAPNTIISVVGNIPNIKEKIEKYFKNMNQKHINDTFVEEKTNQKSKSIEKRKINQTYAVLGYKTPKRKEEESYVLDVIRAILGRGLSGKLFREIRVNRALAYDVGVYHDPNTYYGIFAAYFSTNKKNIQECIKITLNEFKKLKKITEKELQEAKQFIEGDFVLNNEDSQAFANLLGTWEFASKAEDCIDYVDKIKKVTKKDIIRVANKYLNEKYSLAIIEQN
jgi:predicted Zn-dependent peptidase